MDCQNNIEISSSGKNLRCKLNMILESTTTVLLKVSGFLVARDTHSYGMVPAASRYGTPVRGAAVADALSAGSAVMDGETGTKLALALIAAADVLVRNPVRRPCRVFNQTWCWRQRHTMLSALNSVSLYLKKQKTLKAVLRLEKDNVMDVLLSPKSL